MSLKGRTLIITGASRGIGKAIALRAALDGANVAVLAKTTETHPRLPGTVYSAVEEINEAGGVIIADSERKSARGTQDGQQLDSLMAEGQTSGTFNLEAEKPRPDDPPVSVAVPSSVLRRQNRRHR